MMGEVKGVGLIGVGVACAGGRSGGDRRDEIEVSAKCCSLGHDVSDLVLEPLKKAAFANDGECTGSWLGCAG